MENDALINHCVLVLMVSVEHYDNNGCKKISIVTFSTGNKDVLALLSLKPGSEFRSDGRVKPETEGQHKEIPRGLALLSQADIHSTNSDRRQKPSTDV